jgi:hypothetical protein
VPVLEDFENVIKTAGCDFMSSASGFCWTKIAVLGAAKIARLYFLLTGGGNSGLGRTHL